MTNNNLGNPPTLADVRALNDAVIALDEAVMQAEQGVKEIERSALPLRAKLAEIGHLDAQPIAPDPSIVDALVADPTSSPDLDAITATVSAARKASDVRAMEANVISQAIDRIMADAAQARASIGTLLEDRDNAWADFVMAAHAHLLNRFIAEFRALVQDALKPIEGLAKAKRQNGMQIVLYSAGAVRLEEVEFRQPATHGESDWTTIFPVRKAPGETERHWLEHYRDTLSAAPAKRKSSGS